MNNLKNKRIEMGMTLEDVAYKLGMTKSNYYKKECGIISISIDEALKLAQIYKSSLNDLFFNKEVEQNDT